jgi:hypothetical protein
MNVRSKREFFVSLATFAFIFVQLYIQALLAMHNDKLLAVWKVDVPQLAGPTTPAVYLCIFGEISLAILQTFSAKLLYTHASQPWTTATCLLFLKVDVAPVGGIRHCRCIFIYVFKMPPSRHGHRANR